MFLESLIFSRIMIQVVLESTSVLLTCFILLLKYFSIISDVHLKLK